MADKLVAVRVKQPNNTYSNEIPIGALVQNVAYDVNKNLTLKNVLGDIDMEKGNIQAQLNELFNNFQDYIPKAIMQTVGDYLEQHSSYWDPQTALDPTFSVSDLPPISQLTASKDMIAPYVETTMTASQAYNAGDYICINKKLYKTTTAIVSGLALVVGINVAEVTIADELNALRSDISYTPIAISSFTSTVTQAEIGSTVNSVTLNYTFNKVPTTLKLDGNNITPVASGSQVLTDLGLTANKTWTLAATDSGSSSESPHSATKTVTLSFLNKVYYGVKATGTIDSTFVTSLSGKDFAASKAKTFTVTAGANQYIWYACPTSFGQCTFKVGGFDGGFEPTQTISLTNESGHTENYYVYRSTNANLGVTTVIVS